MYLGVPSVIKDRDKRRRLLYGKAGCFRLTSYGVEYRVLSGAMMKDTSTLHFVFNQVCKALNGCRANSDLANSVDICKAINDSDINIAKAIINEYDIV